MKNLKNIAGTGIMLLFASFSIWGINDIDRNHFKNSGKYGNYHVTIKKNGFKREIEMQGYHQELKAISYDEKIWLSTNIPVGRSLEKYTNSDSLNKVFDTIKDREK